MLNISFQFCDVVVATMTAPETAHSGPRVVYEQAPNLLRMLNSRLQTRCEDLHELRFSSAGEVSALAYPRRRVVVKRLRSVSAACGVSASDVEILDAVLTLIPAERHAVRVTSRGRLSLFAKIDVPREAIGTLCAPFGLTRLAEPARAVCAALAASPCGVAVEVAKGPVRLRFYWHTSHWQESLPALTTVAATDLALGDQAGADLAEAWATATPAPADVVVNLGAEQGAPPTLKLELPRVSLRSAARLAREDSGALAAMQAARGTSSASDFPYVGVRWAPHVGRELSFYLDARPLLESP